MKNYVRIWILLTITLTYEYFTLNFIPQFSLSHLAGFAQVSAEPGRPLSLALGWAGITLMIIMNVYILRKRVAIFAKLGGSLSRWLDFHIFCGLVGPTFILFHCNFKVRGLVAISFWSMIIAASSGIVGRYFYTQLLKVKKEMQDEVKSWEDQLSVMGSQSQPLVTSDRLDKLKGKALEYVGAPPECINPDGTIKWNAFQVMIHSFAGDFRLLFDLPKTIKELPPNSRTVLKNYAVAMRKSLFIEPFKNLMGYWHTFHTPFAIFMYLAAIIHIAVALLLGVTK